MNVFAKAFANMKQAKTKDTKAAAPAAETPAEQNARIAAEHGIDLEALPPAPEAPPFDEPPAVPPSTSDEGVLYEWASSSEIVNLSNDPIDSRRRELHVAGRAYHHVAETFGHWLYRRDA